MLSELEFNYNITKKNGKSYFTAQDNRAEGSLRKRLASDIKNKKKTAKRKKALRKRRLNDCKKKLSNSGVMSGIKDTVSGVKDVGTEFLGPTAEAIGDGTDYLYTNFNQIVKQPDKPVNDLHENYKNVFWPAIIGGAATGVYSGKEKAERSNELRLQLQNFYDMKDQEANWNDKMEDALNYAKNELKNLSRDIVADRCKNSKDLLADSYTKLTKIFETQENRLFTKIKRYEMIEQVSEKLKNK